MASIYGVEPYLIVGFLVAWWDYCTEFSTAGEAVECPMDVLTDLAAPIWRSTKMVTALSIQDALKTCRLMDENGHPHDWQEYSGALVTKRAKDAQRKKMERSVSRGLSDGRPNLEKRREENKRLIENSPHNKGKGNGPVSVFDILNQKQPRSIP